MPTILAFVLVFGTIVLFHELGHFLVAKISGVVVYEFAIGFGPRLINKKFGETTYSLRILPLGGFVKLAGMDEAENELDNIDEEDPGSFNNKSLFVRLSTIAAGPLMNFVLAAVILMFYAALIVIPPTIGSINPGSPADLGGLQVGDEILTLNSVEIDNLDQLIAEIRASEGQQLNFAVNREGVNEMISITPNLENGEWSIGVGLTQKSRVPWFAAIGNGIRNMWILSKETVMAIVNMFSGAVKPEVAGPIGIYQLVGTFAAEGIGSLMFLAAVLNVNLGLLNLLPVPVLDGGWILIFIIEAVRGKPIDENHRGIAQLVGLGLLLLLMVFATYSDIVKLFS